jgi:hypothetical protein
MSELIWSNNFDHKSIETDVVYKLFIQIRENKKENYYVLVIDYNDGDHNSMNNYKIHDIINYTIDQATDEEKYCHLSFYIIDKHDNTKKLRYCYLLKEHANEIVENILKKFIK